MSNFKTMSSDNYFLSLCQPHAEFEAISNIRLLENLLQSGKLALMPSKESSEGNNQHR